MLRALFPEHALKQKATRLLTHSYLYAKIWEWLPGESCWLTSTWNSTKTLDGCEMVKHMVVIFIFLYLLSLNDFTISCIYMEFNIQITEITKMLEQNLWPGQRNLWVETPCASESFYCWKEVQDMSILYFLEWRRRTWSQSVINLFI